MEKFLDCYGLDILAGNFGIKNFSANFYAGGRFMLQDFDLNQTWLLDKFFQKIIHSKVGVTNWHSQFFYQSTFIWEDGKIRDYLLGEWLLLDKEPFLEIAGITKIEILKKLKLDDEIYTKLQYIQKSKIPALILSSMLFQSNGLILLSDDASISDEQDEFKEILTELFNRSNCALVFNEGYQRFLLDTKSYKILSSNNS